MSRQCNIVDCLKSGNYVLRADKPGFFDLAIAKWYFCEDHMNEIKDDLFKRIVGEK